MIVILRSREMLNSMFTHLWDMTIIEYLICIPSLLSSLSLSLLSITNSFTASNRYCSQAEGHNQANSCSEFLNFSSNSLLFILVQVQVAGQPELNTNNSREVLDRAVEVRRRRFLRQFYRTVSAAAQ